MFNAKAQWIWDNTDRKAYHHYIQACRSFTITAKQLAASPALLITASSYYQVFVNGKVIGHGPAKSAHGMRSVDTYDLTPYLTVGNNELLVIALSVGAGTMTAACEDAGLIFQINLGRQTIVSDAGTMVRADPTRLKPTARRWIMPCTEDVDATGLSKRTGWKPATVVDGRDVKCYARRVPMPSREVLVPRRVVDMDTLVLPNVNVTFVVKPYLLDRAGLDRCNIHFKHAYLISEIHSPKAQTLELTPALGNVRWHINGKFLVESSGWGTGRYDNQKPTVKLNKGVNLLIGECVRSHHEDMTLAGFVDKPVTFKNPYGKGMFAMAILPDDVEKIEGNAQLTTDWGKLPGLIKNTNPAHSFLDGSSQMLVQGGRITSSLQHLLHDATLDTLTLPAAKAGTASRTIIDLGVLHNGYLSFDVEAQSESRLIFSMFEAIKEDPQVVIHQTGINNVLTFRPVAGRQSFESFFAYGVRYIAICHTGDKPVTLKHFRVLTANCNMIAQGSLQTDDPMINAIYKQGVQTQLSGMDDTYTDCPTFEQVNWNYDNRTTALANYMTFASDAITQNSIRLFAEDPHFQGMVRSQYPSEWENFIPMWSFHWIMWVRDYWWHSGNDGFAKEMMPCIVRGLTDALSKRDARGLFCMGDVWHFVDWAQGRDDNHDVNTSEQAALLGALQAAIALGQAMGKSFAKQTAAWQKDFESIKAAINEYLWCAQRNAYADSLHADGSQSPVSSMPTNAIVCLYGGADDTRSRMLAKRMAEGASGGLLDYGSPLGVFYMTELYDKLGMIEELFAVITENWGEMVLQGDSCGWEQFKKGQPADAYWPTRSRCHPCSAVVIKYLARWVLGVQQQAPGWQKFTVNPLATGIDIKRVWGSIPTPAGLIRVSWTVDPSGKRQIAIAAPKSCKQI